MYFALFCFDCVYFLLRKGIFACIEAIGTRSGKIRPCSKTLLRHPTFFRCSKMSTSDVDISIQLDGSQEVYHSGESVDGIVILRISKFLKVAVLKAEFEGIYTYRNKHGGVDKQQITHAEEKMSIDGKVSDIYPGHYISPFSFTLDPSLPSSLICLAGTVEYKITSNCGYMLTSKSSVVVAEAIKYFSVNRFFDLSDKPLFSLRGAQVKRLHRTNGCCMFCEQELSITMETKKRGFVAGEKIKVNASIDNETSRIVSKIELDVIQVIKSRMKYKVKQKVVGKERGMVMSHSNQVWMDEYLLVPSVPPTSYDHNMIVEYYLRMLLTMDNDKRIKLRMPIIIGNIPVDTNIIEGAGSELSFMYTGEISGGDVVESYVPSYIVFRFSPDAFPSAPAVDEPTN